MSMRSLSRNLISSTSRLSNKAPKILARSGTSNALVNQAKPTLISSLSAQQSRSYYTVEVLSRDQVSDRVQTFHDELLGCNWGDYLEFVHNVPFFEAELERIHKHVGPYLNDPELGPKFDYCLMAFDALYACEDIRDHTNELLELMTRKTGILGMGINAGEPIDNIDEQCEMLAKAYADVLKQYPEMKPKIEQCVGHGLAILRMKHKFAHPEGHRFFY